MCVCVFEVLGGGGFGSTILAEKTDFVATTQTSQCWKIVGGTDGGRKGGEGTIDESQLVIGGPGG